MRYLISFACMAMLADPAAAQTMAESSLRVSNGKCALISHTAKGPEDSDLTKRRTPFMCDKMATNMTDAPGTMMFSFANSHAANGSPISFVAQAVDQTHLNVIRFYVAPGHPIAADHGICELWWRKNDVKSVMCGAVSVQNGIKTTAIVAFDDRALTPVR